MGARLITLLIAFSFIACTFFDNDNITSYGDLAKVPIQPNSIDITVEPSTQVLLETASRQKTSIITDKGEVTDVLISQFYNYANGKIKLRNKLEGELDYQAANTITSQYFRNSKIFKISITKNGMDREIYEFSYKEDGKLESISSTIQTDVSTINMLDVISYGGNDRISSITRSSNVLSQNRIISIQCNSNYCEFVFDGTKYRYSATQSCYKDECTLFLDAGLNDENSLFIAHIRVKRVALKSLIGTFHEIILDEDGATGTFGEYWFHPIMLADIPDDSYISLLSAFAFDWWHPLEISTRTSDDISMKFDHAY